MNMASLNFIDLAFIAIFLYTIVNGLSRGLVKEMVSLLAFILAIVLASLFAAKLASMFTGSAGVQGVLSEANSAIGVNATKPVSYVAIAISFGLIFGVTLLIGAIFGFVLNLFFQVGILGLGNRLLGGAFGFGKGFILYTAIIFVVQLTPFVTASLWRNS